VYVRSLSNYTERRDRGLQDPAGVGLRTSAGSERRIRTNTCYSRTVGLGVESEEVSRAGVLETCKTLFLCANERRDKP
jgi:hypothetical protein